MSFANSACPSLPLAQSASLLGWKYTVEPFSETTPCPEALPSQDLRMMLMAGACVHAALEHGGVYAA